jgi:hypothetical protein
METTSSREVKKHCPVDDDNHEGCTKKAQTQEGLSNCGSYGKDEASTMVGALLEPMTMGRGGRLLVASWCHCKTLHHAPRRLNQSSRK